MNAMNAAADAFDLGILSSEMARMEMARCLRHAVDAFKDEWESGVPLQSVPESASEYWRAFRAGVLSFAPVSAYPKWDDLPAILKLPCLKSMQRVADALEPLRGKPFSEVFPSAPNGGIALLGIVPDPEAAEKQKASRPKGSNTKERQPHD